MINKYTIILCTELQVKPYYQNRDANQRELIFTYLINYIVLFGFWRMIWHHIN